MTYLDIVNAVLMRLREDTIDSVGASSSAVLDDPVAFMVKQFVNDAKRLVEQAHTWNALRKEWTVTTAQGTHTYALADSGDSVVLEEILSSGGLPVREAHISKVRRDALAGGQNTSFRYAVDGVDANLNLQIRLSPVPKGVETYHVYGYKAQPDLNKDTDLCLVPSKPVIYTAMAMAARERGEVGGQTSSDLFSVAQGYLSDAIAIDAATNSLDDIWYS